MISRSNLPVFFKKMAMKEETLYFIAFALIVFNVFLIAVKVIFGLLGVYLP